MDIPKDILLGLPGYTGLTGPLWATVWLLLLVCVSHLLLPALASLNKHARIWQKETNRITFIYDWSYHVIWIGTVPAAVLLIYWFHGEASIFIQKILPGYKLQLDSLRNSMLIPVVSLAVTSVIAGLLYRVNRRGYVDSRMSTWWLPDPVRGPSLVTVAYHVWCALLASVVVAYLIHHLAISVYVHDLLRGPTWSSDVLLDVDRTPLTPLLIDLNRLTGYFISPVYVLVPVLILASFEIGSRLYQLGFKLDGPVILTIFIAIVGSLLLYLIPVLATGLASTISTVNMRPDITNQVSIFPRVMGSLLVVIFSPVYAAIIGYLLAKLSPARTKQDENS